MGQEENSVDKEIMQYLTYNKIPNWRNQVLKGFYRPTKKVKEYWINQGTPGLGDRAAILPDGKTLYIEEKKRSGGKHLETQKDFERNCIKFNAPYILARSAKDVSDFFRIYFKNTEWEKKIIYL